MFGKLGGAMLVETGDLVSNHIVQYVVDYSEENDFVIQAGYFYFDGAIISRRCTSLQRNIYNCQT